MSGALLLAIDQGSHGTAALCFDARGKLRQGSEVPIGIRHGDEGEIEHDPAEILTSVRTAVDRVLNGLGHESGKVRAVGVATQRSSVVCWDRRSLEPLSPVISWQDTRAAGGLESLTLPDDVVRDITGLRKSPHYGASKLRWCLDHVEAVERARASHALAFGPLSSFLTAAITGNRDFMVDPCNASRTLLWDRRSGDWSPEMLETFGIERQLLPRCVANRASFGSLQTVAGSLPVSVCTGDQSAVPFVDGEPDSETVYVNLGTGAFLQKRTTAGERVDPRLLESVIWRAGQERIACTEGTVNGAGAALEWLASTEGWSAEDLANGLDEVISTIDDPPLFLNGVSGLGAPFWVSDFRSRFVGEGRRAARSVAVAESIAFLVMANLRLMGPIGKMVVSGGLSRSRGLCRLLADLARTPVERLEMPEATGRGLANRMLDDASNWQACSRDVIRPRENPALHARWVRWQALMDEALAGG